VGEDVLAGDEITMLLVFTSRDAYQSVLMVLMVMEKDTTMMIFSNGFVMAQSGSSP
jgi:hypothetical protein